MHHDRVWMILRRKKNNNKKKFLQVKVRIGMKVAVVVGKLLF